MICKTDEGIDLIAETREGVSGQYNKYVRMKAIQLVKKLSTFTDLSFTICNETLGLFAPLDRFSYKLRNTMEIKLLCWRKYRH